jgi:hypothetical protein
MATYIAPNRLAFNQNKKKNNKFLFKVRISMNVFYELLLREAESEKWL